MEYNQWEWIEKAADQATLLRKLSHKAGKAIMEIYMQNFNVVKKADSSPLTEADLAAHRVIADGLRKLPGPLAEIPVISEEGSIPDYRERAEWEAWWLIDPLDGTKEFVKKNGEFTVNIALVIRESAGLPGIPVAGWVYAPVREIQYQGIKGKGARRFSYPFSTPGIVLPAESAEGFPRIVASRSHRNPETEEVISAVGKQFGRGKIISSGSSLKLCRIAEGSAELYPRPAPTMEWDTAAGDAVCRASGARVVDAYSGKDLEYGKENLLNPWFLVSANEKILQLSVSVLKKMAEQNQYRESTVSDK